MFTSKRDIILIDGEIKNPIGGDIGWTDFDKMGLSVMGAYNFRRQAYDLYMDDNFGDLIQAINQAELVVGFNHISFDLRLIEATAKALGIPGLKPLEQIPVYDILVESRKGAGVDRYGKGFKLADHLAANLGPGLAKAGHGSEAPRLWKEGKLGALLHYALEDVRLTALLFSHLVEFGCLAVPGREPYRVADPLQFLKQAPEQPSLALTGSVDEIKDIPY